MSPRWLTSGYVVQRARQAKIARPGCKVSKAQGWTKKYLERRWQKPRDCHQPSPPTPTKILGKKKNTQLCQYCTHNVNQIATENKTGHRLGSNLGCSLALFVSDSLGAVPTTQLQPQPAAFPFSFPPHLPVQEVTARWRERTCCHLSRAVPQHPGQSWAALSIPLAVTQAAPSVFC